MTTFWVALIAELAIFFVVQKVANEGNNGTALPLLVVYSLLSGYTLSGIVYMALSSAVGIEGIGVAALGCGATFVAAKSIGSNLSDQDGMALTQTIQLGVIGLVVVMVAQLVLGFFGVITPSFVEVAISAFGVLIFAGVAVVDFYILPRSYRDEQYLPAALSMYLTYINLFVFILRLMIALSGNSRD
jgi:FtsH-binding integral membrane protein